MGKKKEIDLEEMQVLYNQGLSDSKIAERLGCSRKTIAHRRKELGLPINYWMSPIWNQEEIVKKLFSEGKSGAEIARELNVSHNTIAKFKKERNVKSNFDMKMSKEDIEEAMQMANDGLMDSEIADKFGVCASNIWRHRKERNIPSQFDYSKVSKINNEKFEELFYSGLTDDAIGKALNMSADGIYSHRMRYGYFRKSYVEAINNPLTQDNLEIILGIMMGDGSMEKKGKNARLTIAHCPQQRQYRDYIAEKLGNLNPKTYYCLSKPHPKTGKCYESYWINFPANPAFNEICDHFYENRVKRIPLELFDNFTWQSLAYMYMDDGSKSSGGGILATNCFKEGELKQFQKFLLQKFGIETTLCKGNKLYIRKKSFLSMIKGIGPYVCDCMKYKIRESY